ncbi:RNA-directed DNA polymerase from mobile element jockey [Exaiptasia diaphana]|nr:RNA-directed DNA polymerase from mobile element jockey [Exaiptasia diaphana]
MTHGYDVSATKDFVYGIIVNRLTPIPSEFAFHMTNPLVVKAVLDEVKPNKAHGYDLIPPRAIRASSNSIAKPLSTMINTMIARSHVPDTWKHGQITPYHKKDSVLDKVNFRPVTVLPAFAKVFERILHLQMTDHFESIFHDFTFAYRKYHGCAAALLTLTEHWREELDNRKVNAAVAIDLSKAFDCLPHELILEKLKFYGMNDKSVSLLQSYLTSRYQRVKLAQNFYTWMGVSAGVPQGSLLGPLLFNIFMNDLVFAIKNGRLINYADDSKLYLSHKDPIALQEGINQDLSNTTQWFQQNGMIANTDKYQAIVLGNTTHEFKIECSGEPIPISNEIKLLGVTLDSKLKFDSHVKSICRKVGGQVNALNRLKNILPTKTKEALYRAFILPHFFYCSQIWHHCGVRNTKKLEKVNERALRYVYKDKITSYDNLLKFIGSSGSLENRRIQDMLITINNCLQGRAPSSVKSLFKERKTRYNLRGSNIFSLPKVNSTKHGLRSFRYYAANKWNSLPEDIRASGGTKEFVNKIRKNEI